MLSSRVFVSALILLVSLSSGATKPCGPLDKEAVPLVIRGKVLGRKEIIRPAVNCGMKDRSQCSMEDVSQIEVKVISVQKGKLELKKLYLTGGHCSPPPPKAVGKTYTFYLSSKDYYLIFEDEPEVKKP